MVPCAIAGAPRQTTAALAAAIPSRLALVVMRDLHPLECNASLIVVHPGILSRRAVPQPSSGGASTAHHLCCARDHQPLILAASIAILVPLITCISFDHLHQLHTGRLAAERV